MCSIENIVKLQYSLSILTALCTCIPILLFTQEYRDTTIFYCPNETSIDLGEELTLPGSSNVKIDPLLDSRGLIFNPADDPAGKYEITIQQSGGSVKFSLFMEKSQVLNLRIPPVAICENSSATVRLLENQYDSIEWWDGTKNDSITISAQDQGPFTVTAERNGCNYEGEVPV